MSIVVGYDVTISVEKSTTHYLDVVEKLKPIFSKWVFQREETESGYDHWQVRGHLFKKKNLASAIKQFSPLLWHGHMSITSATVHDNNNFNYVMKADTRKDGPWSSTDPELEDPPVLTRQLRDFFSKVNATGFYPWQISLKSLVVEEDDRKLRCIVNSAGGDGKSIFAEYLEYEKLAYEIPPMTSMEDIMQCCMGISAKKCYIVDMPRAMKKDKLAGFYAGLESLKNGVMYDKRYAFKKRRIDRPQIVVFTNQLPDVSLLSPDRWDLYKIIDQNLVPVEFDGSPRVYAV